MTTLRRFIACVSFLTGVVQVKAGLTCFSFTSFSVNLATSGVQSINTSLTTKSCKDNERCSKLKITDTTNTTHESLDCLDQRICNNSISWCQLFTSGSRTMFSTCHVQCCDSDLCARVESGKTNLTLPTPTPARPTIPKASCSIFAPFKVDFKNKQVVEQEMEITEKVCEKNELCGSVTLVDVANKTHYGSDCVSEKLCQNPDIFCKTVTEGSNETFQDCSLKCCNKSLCMDVKNVNITSSKCYQHTPFTVNDKSVQSNDAELKVKVCKKDELCSRATFQDHNNTTHISLDCLSKSICDNPNIICQHFSASNPESAFVRCSIECCRDDFCFTTLSSSASSVQTSTLSRQTVQILSSLSTSQPISSTTIVRTASPSGGLGRSPSSGFVQSPSPSPSSGLGRSPSSGFVQSPSPSPSSGLVQSPSLSSGLVRSPSPSSGLVRSPSPSSSLVRSQSPSPSSSLVRSPSPSSGLVRPPPPSSSFVRSQPPSPLSSLVRSPSPSSSLVRSPSPSSGLVRPPSPSSSFVRSQSPSPSSSLVRSPSPSSSLVRSPSPSSGFVRPPSPSSSLVRSQSPSPSSSVVQSPSPSRDLVHSTSTHSTITSYSTATTQPTFTTTRDVNECDGNNNCSVNAVCDNTVGSYYCTCKTGYFGNGLTCTDIDECKGNHSCSFAAVCQNTIGSYYCICKTGFSGNGLTCTDNDECLLSPSICKSKSCENLYGSHRCSCPLPQLLIGNDCQYVNLYQLQFVVLEGLPFSDAELFNSKSMLHLKSKQEIENAVHQAFSSQNTGVYLVVHLISFSLRNGRIFCQFMLYANPQPSVPTTSSEPIANAFRNALHETSTNNTKKFYLDSKYALNNDSAVDQITLSSIVVDYDECSLTPSPCGTDQRCDNFPGTYRCYCKRPGKELINGNCLDVQAFQGSITITNLEFNEKFINKASIERLMIENKINQIYRNSAMKKDFLKCRVLRFWKGSLGVSYVLLFKSDAEEISTNLVQKVAEDILSVNDSGVFFGDFQLEGNKTNAFQYSDYDECNPPDNNVNICGSNATCMNMESTYSCTCNQGFTGKAPECQAMNIYPGKYVLVEDVRVVKYLLVGTMVYLSLCFLVTLIIMIRFCVISCTKPEDFAVELTSLPEHITFPRPTLRSPSMDTYYKDS